MHDTDLDLLNEHWPASAGRRAFLRGTGLAVAGLAWLQTPSGRATAFADSVEAGRIGRGYDFMATEWARQWVHVPASLLGPGMEEFKQMVEFDGTPLSPSTGTADTVMERLEDAEPGRTVPTRLVGFGNVSTAPVTLHGNGALAGDYWLYVTLSPTHESTGDMVLLAEANGRSGTFVSRVRFAPLFELRPVQEGGESVFVDTGTIALPGFPMELGVSSGRWTLDEPADGVSYGSGQSLHYPASVMLRTDRTQEQVQFDPETPQLTAACSKTEALAV